MDHLRYAREEQDRSTPRRMGMVALEHGEEEVNKTLLCALKTAPFSTQSFSTKDWQLVP